MGRRVAEYQQGPLHGIVENEAQFVLGFTGTPDQVSKIGTLCPFWRDRWGKCIIRQRVLRFLVSLSRVKFSMHGAGKFIRALVTYRVPVEGAVLVSLAQRLLQAGVTVIGQVLCFIFDLLHKLIQASSSGILELWRRPHNFVETSSQ